jgi:hypothetical protein
MSRTMRGVFAVTASLAAVALGCGAHSADHPVDAGIDAPAADVSQAEPDSAADGATDAVEPPADGATDVVEPPADGGGDSPAPVIVSAWLARDMGFVFGSNPLSAPYPSGDPSSLAANKLYDVMSRNALGDPAGAKAFVVRLEDTGTRLHVTFGIAERLERDGGSPLFRFVADPAPIVTDTDRTLTDAGIVQGTSDPLSGAVSFSVTPDAPDPSSILTAAPSAGHTWTVTAAYYAQTGAMRGIMNWAGVLYVTPATACPVWAGGVNLLDVLDNTVADHSADTTACTSPSAPAGSTWSLEYFRAVTFDAVDLLVE